jgi:fructose-bisphosphate aldolase class I
MRDRLTEYFQMGGRFAKWRAVIAIGDEISSWGSQLAKTRFGR